MKKVNSNSYHFICTGNVFRSALAEAICKKSNTIAESSGTYVNLRSYKKLSWPTIYLAKKHNLEKFLPKKVTQTTSLVNDNKIIIFINEKTKNRYLETFNFLPKNYLVWNIEDIPDFENNKDSTDPEVISQIKENADKIYLELKQQIDRLLQ